MALSLDELFPNYEFKPFEVSVKNGREKLFMCFRNDWDNAAQTSVVLAEPAKLAPYLNELATTRNPNWIKPKLTKAFTCLAQAKNPSNPVPASKVGYAQDKPGFLIFGDGITRAQALLEMKADYIPLNVQSHHADKIQQLVGGKHPVLQAGLYVLKAS